jgi:hypothetical protein
LLYYARGYPWLYSANDQKGDYKLTRLLDALVCSFWLFVWFDHSLAQKNMYGGIELTADTHVKMAACAIIFYPDLGIRCPVRVWFPPTQLHKSIPAQLRIIALLFGGSCWVGRVTSHKPHADLDWDIAVWNDYQCIDRARAQEDVN